MRTTIYLATARGLAVIQGCDESWVGEVCLNDKQIQCVAADRTRKGIAYCGTFLEMFFDRAYPDFLPRGTGNDRVCGFQ